jgi:hypothetical protein
MKTRSMEDWRFYLIDLRSIEAKKVDVVGLSDGASSTSEP